MRTMLASFLIAGSAVLSAVPAVATPDAAGDCAIPMHRDRADSAGDKSSSSTDESESITDKVMAALPQTFVQAARLAELGAACKWGANNDERAIARDRLLWAAAAIARRVGVSSAHALSLIEAFRSDAEILAPIKAEVVSSVKDKRACEDNALRETWEASAFLGSKRI